MLPTTLPMLPTMLVVVSTMAASSSGQGRRAPPADSDCRFWSSSSPSIPSLAEGSSSPSVFYWWDRARALCLPCRRCMGVRVTLDPCTLLRDTVCGDRGQLDTTQDHGADYGQEGEDGEAIMHYESMEAEAKDEDEVFGEEVEEERRGEERSPTRAILRHRMVERGHSLKGRQAGRASDYGQPAFFEEPAAARENSVVEQGERPILDVVREFLTTNRSLSAGEKRAMESWVRRGSPPRGFQAEQAVARRARSTTAMALADTEGFDGVERDGLDPDATTKSAGDSAFREIFHLLEDEESKAEEGLEDITVEDKAGKKSKLATLQYILASVSCVVVLLLLLLLALLLKHKLSSKFKLFDETSKSRAKCKADADFHKFICHSSLFA